MKLDHLFILVCSLLTTNAAPSFFGSVASSFGSVAKNGIHFDLSKNVQTKIKGLSEAATAIPQGFSSVTQSVPRLFTGNQFRNSIKSVGTSAAGFVKSDRVQGFVQSSRNGAQRFAKSSRNGAQRFAESARTGVQRFAESNRNAFGTDSSRRYIGEKIRDTGRNALGSNTIRQGVVDLASSKAEDYIRNRLGRWSGNNDNYQSYNSRQQYNELNSQGLGLDTSNPSADYFDAEQNNPINRRSVSVDNPPYRRSQRFPRDEDDLYI